MHTSISDNPEALINYMWMNNTLHFGLRGRQDHMNMLWGDLEIGITSTGREYISFTERATKTRTGAQDPRRFIPKMFVQPGKLCIYTCMYISYFLFLCMIMLVALYLLSGCSTYMTICVFFQKHIFY